MLMLKRNQGQSILLGDDIEIKVLGVKDGQVNIGIVAPRNIHIVRKEIAGSDKSERYQLKTKPQQEKS